MARTWDELTNGLRPKGTYDLKHGLDVIIKANAIYYDKSIDPSPKNLASQLSNAASDDMEKVVSAIDAAIEKHAPVSYIFGCLGIKKQKNYRTQKITNEKSLDIPKVIKTDDQFIPVDSSYDKLYRSEFQHWTWQDPRLWVGKLWVELCHFFPRPWDRKVIVDGGQVVILEAGTIIITERQLAARYKVTRNMIRGLMRRLEAEQMITRAQIARPCRPPKLDPGADPGADPARDPASRKHSAESITVVKLTNYWKYHKKIDAPIWESKTVKTLRETLNETQARPKLDPADHPHIIEVDKERIRETTPIVPSKKISDTEIFEIWEKERGPLFPVAVRRAEDLTELIKYLNGLIGSPEEKWTELVCIARQSDKSYHQYLSPAWLSEKPDRINKLIRGMYSKPFGGENNGKAGKIREFGKGNASDHTAENRKQEDKIKRQGQLGKLTRMPGMQ